MGMEWLLGAVTPWVGALQAFQHGGAAFGVRPVGIVTVWVGAPRAFQHGGTGGILSLGLLDWLMLNLDLDSGAGTGERSVLVGTDGDRGWQTEEPAALGRTTAEEYRNQRWR